MKSRCPALVVLVALVACGDQPSDRTAYFSIDESLATPASFFDFPFPSDLRLRPSGAPDMSGFPNPRNVPILASLVSVIEERRGWPVMPIAYVRFTAPVPQRSLADVIPRDASAPALLIDIDPSSPEVGARFPLVAATLAHDAFVPEHLVALAPRPGIVLRPHTRYAYVLREAFAPGFEPPAAFADLAAGRTPAGPRGKAAAELYAPLWPVLAELGIDDALVATVFTTGDEVARVRERSEAIRASYHPLIENLTLVNGSSYDGFCRLDGTITLPQFQRGTPPFDTDGRFVVDANDVPVRQTELAIPLTLTIPKTAMPVTGWPLYMFFHGSTGISTGLVDLGPSATPNGEPEPGKGPGFVVARHGIAAVSAALPSNHERVPGGNDYPYINLANLAAFPFTFQQGVLEQRMLLDALLALDIPDAVLAGCGAAPSATGHHRFDAAKLVAGGESMGGMYTNMIGAVEPRFGALVPTGAGGFWNMMILETATLPGARSLLATALAVDETTLSFVHPALDTLALGWEIAEPIVYMARLARRPLPGMRVPHIYQPVGMDDSYFPIEVYDAAALANGNPQAGDELWPSMQDALALDGLSGIAPYPIRGNAGGKTRVVVQFAGDGLIDSHEIYRQLDTVKHQYGCFLASYLRDGVATVPAPGALTDTCP